MASYAYFNATLFEFKEDEFKETMDSMANYWRKYYRGADKERFKDTVRELSDPVFISPIVSIPRQLILAAALKGLPTLEEQSWPWPEEAYNSPNLDNQRRELEWLECWYKEARNACNNIDFDTTISLGLSHAYAGFYLTLLYLDSRDPDERTELCKKAEAAFKRIIEGEGTKEEESTLPPLLRHHYSGFYGIYKLVTEENCPEVALKYLREAAQHSSAISGNRIVNVDSLFVCCRAVAAQRAERGLDLEVNYYLEKAGKLAERTRSELHFQLWKAASSEVSRMRGEEGQAQRDEGRAKMGPAAERILRIFRASDAITIR